MRRQQVYTRGIKHYSGTPYLIHYTEKKPTRRRRVSLLIKRIFTHA